MSDFFKISEVNPNDTTGGGGCLATGRIAGEDCEGRWLNFFRVSSEFDTSPYVTICEKHLLEAQEALDYVQDEDVSTEGDPLPIRDQPVTRGSVSRG